MRHIILIYLAATFGVYPTKKDDIISSNLGEPVFFFFFISLEFLPGNKTATHPGHMTLYLHNLFMNVRRVERDKKQTPFMEPLSG